MDVQLKQLKLMWKKIASLDTLYYKSAIDPLGSRVSKNIAYLNDSDPMHQLEVIQPIDVEESLPVIFMIHGGGWVYGEKDSYYKYYAKELSHYGYAVVSMNYSLAFDHPFPAAIQDLFSVFHWAEKQSEFSFDLSRVFFVGDSAGAHLSALCAQIIESKSLQESFGVKAPSFKPLALGLSCGVYDFERLLEGPNDLPLKDILLKVIFNQKDFKNHPLFNLSCVSKNLNESFTPTYLLSSKADSLHHESETFELELRNLKIKHQKHFFPKKDQLPHVFNLKSIYPQSNVVNAEMMAFFASIKT